MSRFFPIHSLRFLLLLYLATSVLAGSEPFAETIEKIPDTDISADQFVLYFPVGGIYPDETETGKLLQFLQSHKTDYILIQASGCKTGGFEASLSVANRRSEVLSRFLSRESIGADKIQVAPSVISREIPENEQRKVELHFFPTEEQKSAALKKAIAASEYWKRQWEIGKNEKTGISPDQFLPPLFIGIPLAALLLVLALIRKRNVLKKRHSFSTGQSEEIQSILQAASLQTGEYDFDSSPQYNSNDISEKIMALKKTTKKKIEKSERKGFSIRSLLDREFASKSLKELSKSPIHALADLTPRHSRMLEEAFGIRTIEDLAALKYVDIARAIKILADYEDSDS